MVKINLNDYLSGRKYHTKVNNMRIYFDSETIVGALVRRISKSDTRYVIGCSAWFTNRRIISALSLKDGVSIICTRDKITQVRTTQERYKQLRPLNGVSPINTLGAGRGRARSLMHHKFLVGLNKDKECIWVSNGSFNMTSSATKNIENCMIFDDPAVASVFKDEFLRLYPLSRPLKIKV